MTVKLRALGGCLAFLLVSSSVQSSAQTTPASGQESPELPPTRLEGTISHTGTVRMFIESAGYPKMEKLWGVYYYTAHRTPIPLEGEWLTSGKIRMFEGDPGDTLNPHPYFDLVVGKSAAVSGTWTSAYGERTHAVRLHRMVKPPGYEMAMRSPRRFADPRWPLEINYPSGWLLGANETELVLRSPDPEDMLYDNQLTCNRGRGLPPAPVAGGARVEFQGSYYRAHDGWRVRGGPGNSDCLIDQCEAPKTRRVGSTVLMSAEIGVRAYNPWGYAGASERTEHLIIDGNDWAHCYDRLLDTDARIQPRSASHRSPR